MSANQTAKRSVLIVVMIAMLAVCMAAQITSAVPKRPGQQESAVSARLLACMEQKEEMQRALQAVHERQRNIGLSAVVMLGDQVVLSESLGHADLEHQIAVTRETRFGIASATKAFTGIALLKLFDAEKIDLDAPIQRYVPSFPEKPGGTITLRLLAAHLAGIRHWRDERTPALCATHFNDVMDILKLFKDDPLVAAPASTYNYSSYGYNLLAAAIQAVARESYQDFVARAILTPLGLQGTGFDDVRRVLPHRARRYSYYEPTTFKEDTAVVYRVPEWDYSHNMGAGNMYATAEDLARFGRALMQPDFLSSRALQLLYTPARTAAAESPWSFGWFVRKPSEGPRRIHITGSNAGLQAAVHVYPDDGLVTVILSNTWGIGSRSGEMAADLPERIAAICMGWTRQKAPAQ